MSSLSNNNSQSKYNYYWTSAIVIRIWQATKSIRFSILLLHFLSTCTIMTAEAQKYDVFPLANLTSDQLTTIASNVVRENKDTPRDCAEILDLNKNVQSGLYTIYPETCPGCYFSVQCDMSTDGGGWTVIMHRFNGSTDFYRGWYFYKFGFGNINGEYYLGNQRINYLTTQKPYELLICMFDVGGMRMTAGYSHFYLGNMSQGFPLHIDSYYGDAGDYLSKSNGQKFSTFDMDNDETGKNCAKYFHSAWWYTSFRDCHQSSNLFGYYFLGKKELPQFAGPGLSWRPVPGPGGPALKEVVMKIRPMGYLGGSRMAVTQSGLRQQPQL